MEHAVTRLLMLLLVVTYGHAAPSCSIPVADRDSCGWTGISQTECQSRGCCFDINATTISWCYHPTGINPCRSNPCTSYETCVPGLNGVHYTCTCPSGRLADGTCKTVDSTCIVPSVLLRKPCGYKGITEAECLDNGCCFDTSAETQYWCYRKFKDVNPCNSWPCRRSETCVRNGAKYACTCPSGRSGVGTACNKASDSTCAIDPRTRKLCGWFGISQSQCADQGCCFEVNAQTMNWCFKRVDVNPCASNPCKNGGACSRNGDTFSCTCSSSWIGSDCGTPNPCGSSPCKNGGGCSNNGASFTCSCPALWTGLDCGTPNPCGSSPCRNGGACINNGASFTCTCTGGWRGVDCSTVPDPCKPKNPCLHGGKCIAAGASFTCTCVSGWTGSDCSTEVNVCLKGNPCLNGGTCVKFGDSYECKCPPNWAGADCEMGSEECHAVLPQNRINCGWGGVTLAQCNERSCCFAPMTSRPHCFYAGDRWRGTITYLRHRCFDKCIGGPYSCTLPVVCPCTGLYHARSSLVACDTMDFKLRADCGFPGISYSQCVGRGCCYDDDEDTNPGPNCYRKANPDCIGVAAVDRVAKGDDGIQPNECTAEGWCWDSSAEPNCFTRV